MKNFLVWFEDDWQGEPGIEADRVEAEDARSAALRFLSQYPSACNGTVCVLEDAPARFDTSKESDTKSTDIKHDEIVTTHRTRWNVEPAT